MDTGKLRKIVELMWKAHSTCKHVDLGCRRLEKAADFIDAQAIEIVQLKALLSDELRKTIK